MVWLNGNWNLDLSTSVPEGASVDIQPGTTIAHTTVQATADYPYSRSHQVCTIQHGYQDLDLGRTGSGH